METSHRSTLKEWTAKPVRCNGKKLVGIICPNCGGRAIVSKGWLHIMPDEETLNYARERGDKVGTVFRTRPCSYCFKAAWLPGEHPDHKS